MLKNILTGLVAANAAVFANVQAQEFKNEATTSATEQHHAGSTSKSMHDDMAVAMQTMHKNMASVKMSGDPDVDFVRMMIPHHQGAIEMAQVYLKTSHDKKIREMAQKIIDDQQREIKDMEKWMKSSRKEGSSAH